ncbi:MAG: bacteriophage abortive infection AbiH family protein [Robiginitomaculum sp.]|nr:bacteriophage abortive infection AbiH family protein [Robiginitomaculum sp.]
MRKDRASFISVGGTPYEITSRDRKGVLEYSSAWPWSDIALSKNLNKDKIKMISKQTLCIIGNGFDLYDWNGKTPNTSYKCFGEYLKDNEPEIYDAFAKHFSLDGNWGNFETVLSEPDIESIWDYLRNYMDDSNPHRSGEVSWEAEKYVGLLTNKMSEALRTFISGEAYKHGGIQYPKNLNGIQLHLPKNALYLSFNYTNTLERYYGILESRICYLHGKSGRDEDLIIGHGVDPEELEIPENLPVMPDNLSAEQQERWLEQMSDQYSFSAELTKEEVNQYWRESFKDTKVIIKEHDEFFQRCAGINRVIIMGHSLSGVDLPYFEEIKKKVDSNAHWSVSYNSEDEKNHLRTAIKNLGVLDEQISLFQLSSPPFN